MIQTGNLSGVPKREAITVEQTASMLDAVRLMDSHRIETLVVVAGNRCIGIFTAWDLVRFLARTPDKDLSLVPMSEAMTNKVIVGRLDDPVADAITLMRKSEIDDLPVLESGTPTGLLRLPDLLFYHIELIEKKLSNMEAYLSDLMDAELD